MPNPRVPLSKAKVSGRDVKDPQRFKPRKEPEVKAGVGDPPPWMGETHRRVWSAFVSEIPWLNYSHRSLLEVAVPIRSRQWEGQEVGVQALNLLRQCLGQMGATPADATKVTVPETDGEDPDEAFFSRPN